MSVLFQLAPFTHAVPHQLHQENRDKLRSRLSKHGIANAVALLYSGDTQNHFDTDHELLFRPESNFNYLFGVAEPDFFGAIHVDTGKSILFIPRLPAEYAVWMGEIKGRDAFKSQYGVDDIYFNDEIASVLQGMGVETIFGLYGQNSDSKSFAQPAKFEKIESFSQNLDVLYKDLAECRVIKNAEEIKLLRWLNGISSDAHKVCMRRLKPGMMEFELESVFLHETYSKGGCRFMSYTCICGSGHNGATLHYGHAGAPNCKKVENGDLCLFDMGAMYHGYCSDITCTFPANGKFTEDQRAIYVAVLEANLAVQRAMKPGVSWPDMHRLAGRVLVQHLVKIGILQGDLEEIIQCHLPAVFMPHGLGHMLGCDTHDVGGYPDGCVRSTEPGLRSLRAGRTLEENMFVTVEPGCYFIDHVLDEALAHPVQSKYINASVLARFRKFGGVRIEDDILVTADGCENFTKVPRTPEEIEAWMAGAQ